MHIRISGSVTTAVEAMAAGLKILTQTVSSWEYSTGDARPMVSGNVTAMSVSEDLLTSRGIWPAFCESSEAFQPHVDRKADP